MEDQGQRNSGSPNSPPRKKAKSLNLQKCDFCRDRKVRCEPQNREWPDKCNHCQRRGEKCSPPSFAMRRPRIQQTSDSSYPSSSNNQSIIEASTVPEGESLGTGCCDVTLPGTVGDMKLTYQQMKDIVTVLRCHHTEYRIEMNQWHWLGTLLRNNEEFGQIEETQFLEKVAKRLRAMSRIQELTLQHVKSLLQSHKHSSAEHILLCQLLVDLETSFTTFTFDSVTWYHQEKPSFVSHQQHIAALLCETGDYNGALTSLHRVPLAQIGGKDLKRMMQLGADLCSRIRMIPKILGIADDLMVLDIFEHLDVLHVILPYSLLAVHSNQWIDDEVFVKESFMWPWIRRSVQEQLEDQPEAPVNWRPTELDIFFRDTFGHTFLHAAFLSRSNDHSKEVIEKILEPDQRYRRLFLVMEWPSYAPGLTPLACSASSLANWEIFQYVLSFEGRHFCGVSDTDTTSHKFCALAIAARNHDFAGVKALVERSTLRKVDISNCCRWVMSSIPSIASTIRNMLVATVYFGE